MKIFMMAASARKDSLNKKLALQASFFAKAAGHEIDLADFKTFTMPMYDGDYEESEGVPSQAKELAMRMKASDAVIFSTPEYNGSIPGSFKNAIDWMSRLDDIDPFDSKPILLLGASPGGFGAVSSLQFSRAPLERLGAFVYPTPFGLPKAHEAFDEAGKFKDERTAKRLSGLVSEFLVFAGKLLSN